MLSRYSKTVVGIVTATLALATLAFPSADARPQAKWTFAIYMCSDNDLDEWAALNTEWLMSAGDSRSVNFIVFWDSSTGPAMLYKIGEGTMTPLTGFKYSGVEVNMGDPRVLDAFVDYVTSKYKAENLLLDLWDHGDDFRGICFDEDTGTRVDEDFLTHQEIAKALAGEDIDIIAGDGCGIGVIEAAYEYVVGGVTAEWFVANENYVPLQGFPYAAIAKDLVANPGMTPEQLAEDIVERYAAMYQGGWLTMLSAIRLSEIRAMVSELWDVTSGLIDKMDAYRGLVASGRAHATMGWSQYGWEAFVDLPKVFETIYEGLPEGCELKVQTAELMAAIAKAVPYIGAGSPGYVWDFGGIAVFFPGAEGSYNHNTWWRGSDYPSMSFAQDGWLDFLNAYFGGK
ncbi:MAG: clostripain-related cysteine peptidase [Thermoplasmata archaeon]